MKEVRRLPGFFLLQFHLSSSFFNPILFLFSFYFTPVSSPAAPPGQGLFPPAGLRLVPPGPALLPSHLQVTLEIKTVF